MSLQIMEAIEGARKVVEANVEPGDNVLIIGSIDLDPVVYEALAAATKALGCEVVLTLMTPRTRFGEEPPAAIAAAMKNTTVVFQCASTSISHSLASTAAKITGVRSISMYFPKGQEIGVLQRAAHVDLDELREASLKCTGLLKTAIKTGRDCHITSELGTNFTCRVREDIGDYIEAMWGMTVGPKRQDKHYAAWPPAVDHVYIAEESANGVFVADTSISGVGPLKEPVRLTFKDGWLTDIKGGEEAKRLEAILAASSPEARQITPEIGMATNRRGKVTGFVAEDKRSEGTLHIAIGRSYTMLFAVPGASEPFANNKSNVHMDAVAYRATLQIGDRIIIRGGEPQWLISGS